MPRKIMCRQCGLYKIHHGRGLCHACLNKPYIREFKKRHPERPAEYQEKYRIKKILEESLQDSLLTKKT